jgi:hypothetical protein
VHFLDWTLEQSDVLGNLGLISRTLAQDINNGCGSRFTTLSEWEDHFITKHPRTAEKLTNLVALAHVEYVNSLKSE